MTRARRFNLGFYYFFESLKMCFQIICYTTIFKNLVFTKAFEFLHGYRSYVFLWLFSFNRSVQKTSRSVQGHGTVIFDPIKSFNRSFLKNIETKKCFKVVKILQENLLESFYCNLCCKYVYQINIIKKHEIVNQRRCWVSSKS